MNTSKTVPNLQDLVADVEQRSYPRTVAELSWSSSLSNGNNTMLASKSFKSTHTIAESSNNLSKSCIHDNNLIKFWSQHSNSSTASTASTTSSRSSSSSSSSSSSDCSSPNMLMDESEHFSLENYDPNYNAYE
jgi:hypothetical protein